jgi:hypothetical protein
MPLAGVRKSDGDEEEHAETASELRARERAEESNAGVLLGASTWGMRSDGAQIPGIRTWGG